MLYVRVTFVESTFFLGKFVHSSNISSVSDEIFINLFGPTLLDARTFQNPKFFTQIFFESYYLFGPNFLYPIFFEPQNFGRQFFLTKFFSEPKSYWTKYSFGYPLTVKLLLQLERIYDLVEKEEKGKQAWVELGQAQLKL